MTYQYNANDVLETVGPAPSGENTKRKQYEYDALGRLTSVCEITSASGSGSCGQNTSATGFVTQYTYDALGDVTKVTQGGGAQTRQYNYDGLRRMTSETNPESGVTSYSYDSDSTCGSSNGDLVKKVDQATNTICYAYDAMHRITSMTVPSGPNAANSASRWFFYDTPCCGYNLTNTKGRLWAGHTCPTSASCSANIVDELFSYDARGEVSDVWEATPHSGGYFHMNQTYWANGTTETLTGYLPSGTLQYGGSYGLDGEGRVSSSGYPAGSTNYLTSTTYNTASEPLQVNFASGDSDAFQYDAMNRMNKYTFTVNGQSVVGMPTWNANWSLGSLSITDPFNSANAQNCTYAHDDLSRIASANCTGSGFSGAYSYDAFGNLQKSGTDTFQPSYNSATNQMTSIGGQTPSYDQDGNVLTDYLNSYSWDAYGRPITVDSVSVTYDALGRMVEQDNSGAYTEIYYSPSGFKMLYMNGVTLVKAMVPLPAGTQEWWTSTANYYRHSDWLGSSRLASNNTRTIYSDGAYGPFGEPYAQSGTPDLNFTGMNQDTSPNVYDFPMREYGIQGRWPSPDPAGLAAVDPMDPQTWNRYAYVRNSPLELVDPFGLCPDGHTCPPQPPPPDNCIIGGVGGSCDEFEILDFLSTPLGYYWQDTGLRVPGTDIAVEELVTVYPDMDDLQLLDLLVGIPITSPATIGPLTGKDKIIARIQCAADYADQNSLASHAAAGGNAGQGGPAPNFLENLFLGNPFSGLVNLGLDAFANRTPSGGEIATTLLSGGRQGMPGGGAGSKGAVGVLQDAGLAKLGGEAAVQGGDLVGSLAIGYHAFSFSNGYLNACSVH